MLNQKHICIFASSSENLAPRYYTLAKELGKELAFSGAALIFGGGRHGLMGALASGAAQNGGRIIGVVPELLNKPGITFKGCTELHCTGTMHSRKQFMEDMADGFIALPGGFGTLEELLEVLTLRQLGYHNKPIVLLNADCFFDPLLEQFEQIFKEGFAHTAFRSLYELAYTPKEAVRLVLEHELIKFPSKLRDLEVSV
ncbi:MAG TPA: TIGR00730 family Rossman fold protein [Clostridia bacterium]|nr:TIGR00730 family Rossman fold protein [Clostridia bacterium]